MKLRSKKFAPIWWLFVSTLCDPYISAFDTKSRTFIDQQQKLQLNRKVY